MVLTKWYGAHAVAVPSAAGTVGAPGGATLTTPCPPDVLPPLTSGVGVRRAALLLLLSIEPRRGMEGADAVEGEWFPVKRMAARRLGRR